MGDCSGADINWVNSNSFTQLLPVSPSPLPFLSQGSSVPDGLLGSERSQRYPVPRDSLPSAPQRPGKSGPSSSSPALWGGLQLLLPGSLPPAPLAPPAALLRPQPYSPPPPNHFAPKVAIPAPGPQDKVQTASDGLKFPMECPCLPGSSISHLPRAPPNRL